MRPPATGTFAEGLERDVVAALRTVPGLYVIADTAVSSYAYTDLSPSEIGGQLGARGIVDAAIELSTAVLRRLSVRLREADGSDGMAPTSTGRLKSWNAIRYEIAEGVAATMLDSSLRQQVVYADRSSAPVSSSKPFQQ